MPLLLSATAVRAFSAPVETTLRQLLLEYGLGMEQELLVSLVTLQETLEHFGLTCLPQLSTGDLDAPRVLSRSGRSSVELALETIGRGETATVEFKSSLCLDRKKMMAHPGKELSEYRLDALIHSVMKTLAAFANTDGGVLFVGVTNDQEVCGLSEDYMLTSPKQPDFDGWDLYLRGQIESRFVDGKAMNAYVRTEALTSNGKEFVKAEVAARDDLTFLKKPGTTCELYIRSGTSSISIAYEDIKKHYEMRRKF